MATSTAARIDVGALASGIAGDGAKRASAAITNATTYLRERNPSCELNEIQLSALVEAVIREFDGFERRVASEIAHDVRRAGVQPWGFPRALADLGDSDA